MSFRKESEGQIVIVNASGKLTAADYEDHSEEQTY